MSNITGTVRASIATPANQTIRNVSVSSANTEVSQSLSSGTKQFMIRVRGNAILKLAFRSSESATNYITVPMGCSYFESDVDFTGTLYFQTNKASQVIEIVEWS
jgi:hypothetical protein